MSTIYAFANDIAGSHCTVIACGTVEQLAEMVGPNNEFPGTDDYHQTPTELVVLYGDAAAGERVAYERVERRPLDILFA